MTQKKKPNPPSSNGDSKRHPRFAARRTRKLVCQFAGCAGCHICLLFLPYAPRRNKNEPTKWIEEARQIVKLEIKNLEKRLADKEITVSVSDAALDFLTDIGFDPVYGARPLKRTIQKELETVVARGVLAGEYGEGDGIAVDAVGDRLEVYKTFDGSLSNNDDYDGYNETPEPAGYAGYTEDYSETPPFN